MSTSSSSESTTHYQKRWPRACLNMKSNASSIVLPLISHRHPNPPCSVWKPLRGPLEDWPLCVCDATTVDAEKDLVPSDQVFPKHVVENIQVHRNPSQKWYYLSEQTEDELWIFQQSAGRSRVSPILVSSLSSLSKLILSNMVQVTPTARSSTKRFAQTASCARASSAEHWYTSENARALAQGDLMRYRFVCLPIIQQMFYISPRPEHHKIIKVVLIELILRLVGTMLAVYLRRKVQILLIMSRRVFLGAFHDRVFLKAQASFLSLKERAIPYVVKGVIKPFAGRYQQHD
jgi:hypothetical protein